MLKFLHPDEAVRLVVENARRVRPNPGTEKVPIGTAAGRALAGPVVSPIDHPPFDKSSMDGFAYAGSGPDGIDAPGSVYEVVDAVAAGQRSDAALSAGRAVRIMTGAPIPRGATAVQRVEWTEPAGDHGRRVRFTARESADNIIRRGENLAAGAPLLGPRLLAAQDIGILASAGYAEVEVVAAPRVGVVSTGDEIEAAGAPLSGASIYDSNGPQLCAQAASEGASVRFFGIFRDDRKALADALGKALDACDVVLVSGGVSMGDFDFVPSALEERGVESVFHSLAMKPGKPTFFGMRGEVAAFGLPGNPVSTFVNFEVLIKPYLRALAGLQYCPRIVAARLAAPLARKSTERVEFLPARLEAGREGMPLAEPLAYRGSSMITVLAEADALLRMEIGQARIEEGALVHARLIRA